MSKAIAEIAEQAQFEEKGFFTLNLGGAVEQLYETFGSPGNLTFPSLTRWTAEAAVTDEGYINSLKAK
eukprot:4766830-Prymnesium_polylepis.1